MDRLQLAVSTTWSRGTSCFLYFTLGFIILDFRALGPAIGGSIGIMFTVSRFSQLLIWSWIWPSAFKRWQTQCQLEPTRLVLLPLSAISCRWFSWNVKAKKAKQFSLEMSKQRKWKSFCLKIFFSRTHFLASMELWTRDVGKLVVGDILFGFFALIISLFVYRFLVFIYEYAFIDFIMCLLFQCCSALMSLFVHRILGCCFVQLMIILVSGITTSV